MSKVECDPSQSIAICIDNNICQELAKWENNNNVDPKTRIKVETFLKECADYNLFVFPYIGLTELSTNRQTGKLDQVKYVSHQKSISSCLTKHNIQILPPTPEFEDGMKYFMKLHNLFYIHLLKIKLIELNGLNKDKALNNLSTYLNWAEEIEAQTSYPSQVAHALFGGESKARKIVKIEKQKEPLQSVWGAAWDMLYLFLAQQYFPIKFYSMKMLFATNDEALWLIGSLFKLRGALTNGGHVQYSMCELSFDFPHYDTFQNQIKQIHQGVRTAQIGRLNKGRDLHYINGEKVKLEREFNEKYKYQEA